MIFYADVQSKEQAADFAYAGRPKDAVMMGHRIAWYLAKYGDLLSGNRRKESEICLI